MLPENAPKNDSEARPHRRPRRRFDFDWVFEDEGDDDDESALRNFQMRS